MEAIVTDPELPFGGHEGGYGEGLKFESITDVTVTSGRM